MRSASSAPIGSPREKELRGASGADDRRQPIEAAYIADESPFDEQFSEHRLLRRDTDVGVQRQFHAPAHGRAVDRGDHRLVAIQRGHRRGRRTVPDHGGGRFGGDGLRGRHDLAHVVARAEGGVGAGHDHAARRGVGHRSAEGRFQSVIGFEIEGVSPLRTIQGDRGDVILDRIEDAAGIVAHGFLQLYRPPR